MDKKLKRLINKLKKSSENNIKISDKIESENKTASFILKVEATAINWCIKEIIKTTK
jgi:hypothetical protein